MRTATLLLVLVGAAACGHTPVITGEPPARAGVAAAGGDAASFTEGVDLKKTSCVLNARPMTPASLRVLGPQIVGRGTRLSPETGKRETIYIEFLDKDRATGVRAKRSGGKSGMRGAASPRATAARSSRRRSRRTRRAAPC